MSETTLAAGPFKASTSIPEAAVAADVYVVVTKTIGEDEQETTVIADEMIVDRDLFAVRDGKRIAGFRNWNRYGRQAVER